MSGVAPRLAAVLGWPIGHSRSPRLHGHWLRRYGIAGHYIPISLPPDELEAGLKSLRILGFRGANVTIPHKVAVLALAASATEAATRIGAANTITFGPDGGFHADNTDGFGFVASLRQAAPVWSAKLGPALVLGAGGAARGVVSALLDEGAPEIRVANRTFERAEALRAHLGDRVTPVKWIHATDAAEGVATVVNTTSLGMAGQPLLPFQPDTAPPDALVADLVCQPLETPLLAAARARGLTAVDGLGMLLHQAVPGFEAWFGRRPEVDDDLRAAVLAE
jgi:shikimate dehydrogenase